MSGWHDFPNTRAALEEGLERGLHQGAQIYVSRRGRVLLDGALGEARPGVPMTPETLNFWLSSGKPLTTALLGVAQQRGQLHVDDPVHRHLPAWDVPGKRDVTLRHLLTHTAGVGNIETGWPGRGWNEIVEQVAAAELHPAAEPGARAAYVPAASWFLLGEIVARSCDRPFPTVLRDELLLPLGMANTWCGMSEEEYQGVADRIGGMSARTRDGLADLEWHQPGHCRPASPGAGTLGPIRELGRFYESLLAALAGEPGTLLQAETVRDMTHRHRRGMHDETFQHVLDWGLGLIVNSNRYDTGLLPYGFGRFASEEAFGHGGAQSSMGFADPAHGLVVAWVANGRPGEPRHNQRNRRVNDAVYRDLGLAAERGATAPRRQ